MVYLQTILISSHGHRQFFLLLSFSLVWLRLINPRYTTMNNYFLVYLSAIVPKNPTDNDYLKMLDMTISWSIHTQWVLILMSCRWTVDLCWLIWPSSINFLIENKSWPGEEPPAVPVTKKSAALSISGSHSLLHQTLTFGGMQWVNLGHKETQEAFNS